MDYMYEGSEVRQVTESYPASKEHNQDVNPGSIVKESMLFTTMLSSLISVFSENTRHSI